MAFTKDQPKDGDTILHCGHFRRGLHWFKYEDGPMKFARPDGTRGQAEWFVSCEACFMRHGEKVAKIVRGDEVWEGDVPIVVETVKS